nr:hypothetical protein [Tanacetum cinerariifolium]
FKLLSLQAPIRGRVHRLPKPMGTTSTGITPVKGKLLLMLDADGAPKVDDVAKLEKQVGISSGISE